MAKSIFLFKINENFNALKKENNLEIILDIFIKSFSSEFFYEQINLIIEKLDYNIIKNNLINNFKNRSNFYIYEKKLIIKNIFKDQEEIISFEESYIKITIEEEKSLFIDYLSLYFVDLIAIELEDEKIYPLHLVKNTILV